MKNLITAIVSRCTSAQTIDGAWADTVDTIWQDTRSVSWIDATLLDAIGGRIYYGKAPQDAQFPYIVFSIDASQHNDFFSGEIRDTVIEFSIYSISPLVEEVSTIQGYLKSLFKDSTISITGGTNIAFEQQTVTTSTDNITSGQGTTLIRHWATDYLVMVEAA